MRTKYNIDSSPPESEQVVRAKVQSYALQNIRHFLIRILAKNKCSPARNLDSKHNATRHSATDVATQARLLPFINQNLTSSQS
jgi:hypothetical protein